MAAAARREAVAAVVRTAGLMTGEAAALREGVEDVECRAL